MELIPLHKCPEYMNECADVLNEEWKRSLTARLHSLNKSKDTFPICLVLLEGGDGDKKCVVGSSRLSEVQGQPQKSCLVESVVVRKSHRGKGYGRIIMQQTEQFAASQDYKVMYLTTHDKQDFYKHLGYEFCSSVVTIAMDILPDHLAQQLMRGLNMTSTVDDHHTETDTPSLRPTSHAEVMTSPSSTSPPQPPPQPPQVPPSSQQYTSTSSAPGHAPPVPPLPGQRPPSPSSAPPPPPPPPPIPGQPDLSSVPTPPPLPGQSVPMANQPPAAPPPPGIAPSTPALNTSSIDSSNSNVRWDPSKVSWMKKCI